jgi:hypothetical protein
MKNCKSFRSEVSGGSDEGKYMNIAITKDVVIQITHPIATMAAARAAVITIIVTLSLERLKISIGLWAT